MNGSTRLALRKAWGMCERHAWGWLLVEASFRPNFLHGPAVLYEDIMSLAAPAFRIISPGKRWRLLKSLGARGPCLMCDLGYGPASRGRVEQAVVDRGRDIKPLESLAIRTEGYWRESVCGKCAGIDSPIRCRRHFLEGIWTCKAEDIVRQQLLVEKINQRVKKYSRSFRWELRGTATDEDAAALLSAVGWLSGWGVFLHLLDHAPTEG